MAEPIVSEIICSVLDWTIRQPIAITLPKDSKILCVMYHDNYDHLYCISSLNVKKEIRYFIVKQPNQRLESIHDMIYHYIGSTMDEDSETWHIFELISTTKQETPDRKSRLRNQH